MSEPAAAARLLDAERGVQVARDRLGLTVAELQERLDPRLLANRAKRKAVHAGDIATRSSKDAAHASIDKARANPGAVVGVVAALLVFAVRHRFAALFHAAPPPPDPATER